MRLLVTGSRIWPAPLLVTEWLDHYVWHKDEFTLVHGACPYGVDAIADGWATRKNQFRRNPIVVERHPADWDKYGKAAGFRRNAEMVELGADVVLAFIYKGSRGATHTATLAQENALRVHRFDLTENYHFPTPLITA